MKKEDNLLLRHASLFTLLTLHYTFALSKKSLFSFANINRIATGIYKFMNYWCLTQKRSFVINFTFISLLKVIECRGVSVPFPNISPPLDRTGSMSLPTLTDDKPI